MFAKMSDVLKYIILFFQLGKKYADSVAGGGSYTYTDDGDGNITITKE